ncbi:MAG TPA: iron-containing alcohol dehydrogenase, partial [Burkholderiaceae bacterium]|nr:iron-containing alcohol dehydrogenase [Burkholderiaceae bacterium]
MDYFGTMRAPRQLISGCGQRNALGRVAQALGRRALVITDQRLAADPDFKNMVADLNANGLVTQVSSDTLPDVPAESTVRLAEAVRSFQADMVIGVGGGSCLDMAKCVALLLTHGGLPQDYYGEFKVPGPLMPLIAIPTTAGTGS